MKVLLNLLFLFPLIPVAQGVKFESGLNWLQVKEKARTENKYIFIDCFATWCGPCKQMDKEVYPNDTVGKYLNEHFVSIKVQMDTSKKDEPMSQSWYADAHEIMVTYKISAFPTFLFLSPDDKIVHRNLGYQNPADFVRIATDAVNPEKQYYTLLQSYQSGEKNYSVLPYLANSAKTFNEPELAASIAVEYLHNYLDKLRNTEICTKANLDFIATFAKILKPKDKVFQCLYKHGELANSAMRDNEYALRFVNYIVTKEEVTPLIAWAQKNGKNPDWEKISKNIQLKYGSPYVQPVVIRSKVAWYKSERDWRNYTRYLVLQMDLQGVPDVPQGLMGMLVLNNNAWDIFQYSDNKQELEKAVVWSDKAIQMDSIPPPTMLDTKANLLYKLGNKKEAVSIEERALGLDPHDNDIQANLAKMLQGKPTWVTY